MTAADVINLVRRILKDTDGNQFRWPNTILLKHLSDSQRELRQVAPHSFLTLSDSMNAAADVTALTATLDLDEDHRRVLADMTAAKALSEDSDDAGNRDQVDAHTSMASRGLGIGPLNG